MPRKEAGGGEGVHWHGGIVRFAHLAGAELGDRVHGNAQASSAEGGYAAGLRNSYANDRLVGADSRALGGRPQQSCRATPLALLFRRAEEERIARRPGRLLLVQSGYPAADGYGPN